MSRGFGQPVQIQQFGGLAQLLVVEIGGLVVELGRVLHLRHRVRLVLFGGRSEHPPESIAETA